MKIEKRLYVFTGYANEYVLQPLAKYFRDRQYDVLEFDLCEENNFYEKIKGIQGRRIVFITSWHLFFDDYNFSSYNKSKKEIRSPLEMIAYLKPEKTVYYPHDLATILHPSDREWIDLFDVLLVPYMSNEAILLKKLIKIIDVGWIKKNRATKNKIKDKISNGIKGIYLPSNIFFVMGDLSEELYVDKIAPLLELGIAIKTFHWDGIQKINDIIQNRGYKILDSNISLFELIDDYDFVISNGVSSVIFEAYLSGIPVIALLDGALPESIYKKMLPDGVIVKTIEDAVEFLNNKKERDEKLCYREDLLEPFNFELALKIISE